MYRYSSLFSRLLAHTASPNRRCGACKLLCEQEATRSVVTPVRPPAREDARATEVTPLISQVFRPVSSSQDLLIHLGEDRPCKYFAQENNTIMRSQPGSGPLDLQVLLTTISTTEILYSSQCISLQSQIPPFLAIY